MSETPQLALWEQSPSESPASGEALLAALDQWVELGWLRALDQGFARFIHQATAEQGVPAPSPLLLLAALVSHQVGRGHVCLDLNQLCDDPENTLALPPEGYDAARLDPGRAAVRPATLLLELSPGLLHAALADSPAAGEPAAQADRPTPLVVSGNRVYLHRYWRYEQRIAAGIRQRLDRPTAVARADSPEAITLGQALAVLFPDAGDASGPDPEPDYQKVACALAARGGFSVITGGPGTGKTTTVVRLLAALQSVAGQGLRIRLAAPTGKAAARLSESIGGAVERLPLAQLPGKPAIDSIPARVTTLHRLLGSRPGSRGFRHNPDNPLALDVLVIDEASMVDVDLMASVFDALPAKARLILLGDKDQLASVDAGAVLGELCLRAGAGHYTPATLQWLQGITGVHLPPALGDPDGGPLDQAVAMLRTSYRFGADSGIGILAGAVNDSALDGALVQRCRNGGFNDIAWLRLAGAGPDEQSRAIAAHGLDGSADRFPRGGVGRQVNGSAVAPPVGYRHYLERMRRPPPVDAALAQWDQWAGQVLAAFGDFQILCALRRGPHGVEGINQLMAEVLRDAGLISRTGGWYAGRPVLVTGNDYNLGLMNGDIGMTLSVPLAADLDTDDTTGMALRVAFPATDGSQGVRWIAPSRLQSVETVYAMTVHKSQGSEFTHTCLIIPDKLTPVLTRELIYTGVTRARHWLSLLVTDERVLRTAVGRGVIRASGLGKLLGSPENV